MDRVRALSACAGRAMRHAKRSKMSADDVAFAIRELFPAKLAEESLQLAAHAVEKLEAATAKKKSE